MIIRSATPDDEDAIHHLTAAAFATASHASGTESQIIRELRKDGDLTISLIVEDDGEIVGHIAFSPVSIGGRHDDWFGLGGKCREISQNCRESAGLLLQKASASQGVR